MLEGLHDVPWADLEHAYGSAADVPDQLLALLSPDPQQRAKTRWRLYGNIYHQGTRYEASAYAAPFLLDMLADTSTPDRPEMLDLLTSLAVGMDEAWLPGGFPVDEYRERAAGGETVLRSFPPVSDDADDDSRYLHFESLSEEDQVRFFAYVELAVYDAVRAGVPVLRKLLRDGDPRLRLGAAYALGWFPEDATAVTDQRDTVRWAAAIALAHLDGPAASPDVTTELLTWAGGTSRSHSHDTIPYYGGDLAGYAVLALRQLGDAHQAALFDVLLARIPAVSGPEAMPVVGQALRIAFPDGRLADGTAFADLTEPQRRLAASPDTWGWGEYTLFGNFTSMVASYGLPRDADAMRRYATP